MKNKVIDVLKFYEVPEFHQDECANKIIQLFQNKRNYKKFNRTSFKNVLLDLGAEDFHIEDWLAVRKQKKAVNTESSLNRFLNECKNNNFPVSEAVKIATENSWSGFKVEWVKNIKTNGQQSIAKNATEAVREFFDTSEH